MVLTRYINRCAVSTNNTSKFNLKLQPPLAWCRRETIHHSRPQQDLMLEADDLEKSLRSKVDLYCEQDAEPSVYLILIFSHSEKKFFRRLIKKDGLLSKHLQGLLVKIEIKIISYLLSLWRSLWFKENSEEPARR